MLGFELTHIFLWAAFITCLLKPKNFLIALLFILVHFLFIDVVSEDYVFVGVKLAPASWLLLTGLIAFFLGCVTYLSKNYAICAIFLLNFAIRSYIYIVTPEQASNFLWHGYGNLYYNNLLSIDLGFWLSLAPFMALMVENVRAYYDGSLSIVNHIVCSNRDIDPYFKKAGCK